MSESQVSSYHEVKGNKVWFDQIGSGPNPILLIPGPIGTGKTDFGELFADDDIDFDQFTIISVDCPGSGRSRPPVRHYGVNVYDNDSECLHSVMKHLGYDKYSIMGFSEGAKVALLMSIKYPESVNSLVLIAFSTYYSSKGVAALLSDKSVKDWKEGRHELYVRAYKTEDETQKLWNRYIKFVQFYNQYFPEDIFKNRYNSVKCPVLIFHGDKDQYIEVDQALSLIKRLVNAKLHRFPLGEHDCHRKYFSKVWDMTQDQILNPSNYQARTVDILAQKIIGLD